VTAYAPMPLRLPDKLGSRRDPVTAGEIVWLLASR
jgi:hypothetical protein